MAYKRLNVGSVVKGKDGKMDYIKLNPNAVKDFVEVLQNTDPNKLFLNLESVESQLENLDNAVENGKLSPEKAAEARKRIEATPEFVRFQIVLVQK